MKKLFAILFCTALLIGVLAVPAGATVLPTGPCDTAGMLYKLDGNYNTTVLPAGTEFCVKAANNNSGKLTADGTTSLYDYVTWLNNGGQHPDVSHYVVYSFPPEVRYEFDQRRVVTCDGWKRQYRYKVVGGPWSPWVLAEKGTWQDKYTIESVKAKSIEVDGPFGSHTFNYVAFDEPEKCLGYFCTDYPDDPLCKPPKECVLEPQYYQFTIHNEGRSCTLVSWDTKDEIGKPNEFWIPNAMRQLCNCGFVAESKYESGWVYKDSCTGEYSYLGKSWGWFKPDLLAPHWDGTCGVGGC